MRKDSLGNAWITEIIGDVLGHAHELERGAVRLSSIIRSAIKGLRTKRCSVRLSRRRYPHAGPPGYGLFQGAWSLTTVPRDDLCKAGDLQFLHYVRTFYPFNSWFSPPALILPV